MGDESEKWSMSVRGSSGLAATSEQDQKGQRDDECDRHVPEDVGIAKNSSLGLDQAFQRQQRLVCEGSDRSEVAVVVRRDCEHRLRLSLWPPAP